MTLVQLSDTHIHATMGGDPTGDLHAAVDAVLALRPTPTAVLVSGDLVDDGSEAAYVEVREQLDRLGVPVHVMAGNHDDRAGLRAAFPLEDGAAPDAPYRYATTVDGLRIVACDTIVPRAVGGAHGAEALAWLADRLAEDTVTPTLVAVHHHPFPIGLPEFDAIGLPPEDRAALGELLGTHPQVRAVTCGHVHLAAQGRVGRTPVLASPSTWRRHFRLDLGEPGLHPVMGPAGFVVHVLVDGELVSHVRMLDPA